MSTEDTPPAGTRWTAFVPRWVKLVAPLVGVLLTLGGGVAGASLKFGTISERVDQQGAKIAVLEVGRVSDLAMFSASTAATRESIGELRGRLDAMLDFFKIPYPPNEPQP